MMDKLIEELPDTSAAAVRDQHGYTWVRDTHRGLCLCKLRMFVWGYNNWVGWRNWTARLQKLLFFDEPPYPLGGAIHWNRCLCRLQVIGKHLHACVFRGTFVWKRTKPIYRVPCQASPFTALPLGSKVFLVSCMHFCLIQVFAGFKLTVVVKLLTLNFVGFNFCWIQRLLSILLALLISAILSNISFIKLSSLLSRYPASSFGTSPC